MLTVGFRNECCVFLFARRLPALLCGMQVMKSRAVGIVFSRGSPLPGDCTWGVVYFVPVKVSRLTPPKFLLTPWPIQAKWSKAK